MKRKDLVKEIQKYENSLYWVCDNEQKIGKHIYGIEMQSPEAIIDMNNPQILLAIANEEEVKEVREQLALWNMNPIKDFWQFL